MTRLAWIGVAAGAAALTWSVYGAWTHAGSASLRVVSGMRMTLPDDLAASLPEDAGGTGCTLGEAPCRIERTLDGEGRSVKAVRLRLAKDARAIQGESRSVVDLRIGSHVVQVGIAPGWTALLAAAGVLLLLAFLPAVIFGKGGATAQSGGPWRNLLSEPGGGLSLARAQLLVWFVPALLAYAAVSIPALAFAPIDSTLAVLLGMSGATTALGAVASPTARPAPLGIIALPPPSPFPRMDGPAPLLARAEDPPRFADLVEDWEGRGDFSRYQYLLLSIVGAVILAAGFATNLSFPPLPAQFVALIGASQATYLGTKAVKTAKQDAAQATKSST